MVSSPEVDWEPPRTLTVLIQHIEYALAGLKGYRAGLEEACPQPYLFDDDGVLTHLRVLVTLAEHNARQRSTQIRCWQAKKLTSSECGRVDRYLALIEELREESATLLVLLDGVRNLPDDYRRAPAKKRGRDPRWIPDRVKSD